MELVAQGMRNKEIAAMLSISEATIRVHLKNISRSWKCTIARPRWAWPLRRGIVHI